LLAFADHGLPGTTLPADGGPAEAVLEEFRREGVDDDALAGQLQRDGVLAFGKSWGALLARIREKSVGSATNGSTAKAAPVEHPQ
jgi:transaldolase